MKMTIFRSRTWAAAAVLLAATTVFASCEKDDSPEEETGENTFTLTGGPGVGNMVYVTDYPLSGETEYQDVADDHIAYGVIEAGNACEFAYWEGANTGTFNVLVRSSGEMRAESGDVFKYKNGVQFTGGVASLDWSGMTEIESQDGGEDDPGEDELSEDWDGTLVLPEGEVWLKNTSDTNKNGYIFHADATYNSFNNYDGETIGEWVIVTDNEYRVSGDELTIYTASGAIWMYTYTISGNTLTLDFLGSIETYTRRAGINPTDNVY